MLTNFLKENLLRTGVYISIIIQYLVHVPLISRFTQISINTGKLSSFTVTLFFAGLDNHHLSFCMTLDSIY